MQMNVVTFGAILLLVGGVINTIPPISTGLANLFNGTPILQIAIGALSVIPGLVIFMKKAALN